MTKQIKRAGFDAIRDDVFLRVTGHVATPEVGSVSVVLDSMRVERTLTLGAGAARDSLAAHIGRRVEVDGRWSEKEQRLDVTTFTLFEASATGIVIPAPAAAYDTLYPAPRDSVR